MRRIFAVAVGILIGGGTVFAAFQWHLVRTDQRFLVVPKEAADWRDAYVDIRDWTVDDWAEHPLLARNLIAAGHADLVTRSATDGLFRGFLDSFRSGAAEDQSAGGER